MAPYGAWVIMVATRSPLRDLAVWPHPLKAQFGAISTVCHHLGLGPELLNDVTALEMVRRFTEAGILHGASRTYNI